MQTINKHGRRALGLGLVLTLLATLLLAACAAPSEPETPSPETREATIIVEPNSGAEKTKLTISGSRFLPGENVKVALDVDGLILVLADKETGGFSTADSNGEFVLKPRGGIPRAAAVPPGVYPLEAKGDKGSYAKTELEILAKQ